MIEIKEISPEDTYDIRNEVFQTNRTKKLYSYEGDYFWGSFHLGAFLDDRLISIASFYNEKNPLFEEESQYRLRGMATLKKYRGQKAGTALLNEGEKMLKKKHARLLWCYAKYPVSNYYTNFGLREHGEAFVIDSIGPHKLMYKML